MNKLKGKNNMDSMFNNYQGNMPKLSNEESSKLDFEVTLNELYTQIFSTKNNKSPGPDGFTMSFKLFFGCIKLSFTRANDLFQRQSISTKTFY